MSVLITDKSDALAGWVAGRLPHVGNVDQFGTYAAIGVASGTGPDDRIIAAMVLWDINPGYGRCQVTMASANARWASRATLRAVLAVPFMEYGLNRIWTVFPAPLTRVGRFLKAIGFTCEGTLRDHFGKGISGSVYRMHASDYEKRYWAEKPEMKKAA
jgi:RimJ/RimL family protein N-acetyltransferase